MNLKPVGQNIAHQRRCPSWRTARFCKLFPGIRQGNQATFGIGLCKQLDALLLINDDVDIAVEVNADGVHLGPEDMDIQEARARLGSDKIIGITCHNDIQLAREAEQAGADYVALGRFFGSSSKPSAPPASLDTLQQAVNELSIPVCAIGGISPENAPKLIGKGAHMIAVINGVFGTWNVTKAAKAYTKLFGH